jgi:glycosyltransferase involved in cell wall biosynthesis
VETLDVGGLERLAVDLALALRDSGHQNAVYCLFRAGRLRRDLDDAGIPVAEFNKPLHSRPALVWSIAQRLRADRVEVIHGHNPAVHHFAAAAKFAADVPVCLNTRHSAVSSTGEPYQERYFRWVEPLTNHVVFVCEYVKKQLEPQLNYRPEKCSVIRSGIQLQKFLAHPAAPGGLWPRVRFGTIGRFVPAKGHAILIDAFSTIAAKLPQAELCIFGYGPLEGQLRAQIRRLGLEGRIRLEGATDSASAFELFDIFVLSSLNEGLPLVILEAMAAGLPLVSTRVGGIPEVAPEGSFSWLARPGSVDDLSAAMLRAAKSHLLAASGAEARRVAMNYTIAEMSNNYEKLYERLMCAAAPTRPALLLGRRRYW